MGIYSGKTALVTGSRGIGEAIVRSLFSQGANVIIVSATESCEKLATSLHSAQIPEKLPESGDASIIDKTTSKIEQVFHIGSSSSTSHGAQKAIGIRCDLSSATAAAELGKRVIAAAKEMPGNSHVTIDYIILCAGIMTTKTLEEVDEQAWNRTFAINVTGPVFLTKELAPSIAHDGHILFFSSSLTLASTLPAHNLPYVATKGAIEQIVRALAKDQSLVSRGIATTTVSPGQTETEMYLTGKSESFLETVRNMNPYKRLGKTEDIVEVVNGILVAGKWINGANIRCNGGYSL